MLSLWFVKEKLLKFSLSFRTTPRFIFPFYYYNLIWYLEGEGQTIHMP